MIEADALARLHMAFRQHCAGQLEAARHSYRAVLAHDPGTADALHLSGVIRQQQGDHAGAVTLIRRAARIDPSADVLINLALAFGSLGDTVRENAACRHAVQVRPDAPQPYARLGARLLAGNRPVDAATALRAALRLDPWLWEACLHLGNAFQAQGDLDRAAASYRATLALKPDCPEALHNLAILLWAGERRADALATCRRLLAIHPGYKLASHGAILLVKMGDYEKGWRHFKRHGLTETGGDWERPFDVPVWNGNRDPSGRIYIWSQQGVGDEVMFSRFALALSQAGPDCVLECHPRLHPLFSRSFPQLSLARRVEMPSAPALPPGTVAHIESSDLLPILCPSISGCADGLSLPYLRADPALRKQLRERYDDGRLVVGVSWHTQDPASGPARSMDLSCLKPLFALPGIRWVSLQYGDLDALDRDLTAAGAGAALDREVDSLADLDVFAAQVAAMDLVVTIDNTTLHFGGALGVPTWGLLCRNADWRWLEERTDSPWYPSVRLFRQATQGDWTTVVDRAAQELAHLAGTRSGAP